MKLGISKLALDILSVIACLTLLFVPVPATDRLAQLPTPNSTANWQRYTVKGEEFSADLPVIPAMTTRTLHLLRLNKDRQERVIGAYADGVVYTIHTFENPRHRQSLDELITEFNRGPSDSVPRDLLLNGFKGTEYLFDSDGRKSITQFFITERHVYRFMAMGSTLVNPDEAISKFISSIKIEKKPEGVEIENGPGEQSSSEVPLTTVFSGKVVTRKAIVLTKPEPKYTEDARRNQTAGTVVLRAVFTSSGAVTNIRAMSGLPGGLTERAIAAARQIKFIPAIKDGNFVSMYIQLEYNFNLY